jgi:hypothetical protein
LPHDATVLFDDILSTLHDDTDGIVSQVLRNYRIQQRLEKARFSNRVRGSSISPSWESSSFNSLDSIENDLSPGSTWKSTGKRLGLPIATVMDILVAGKMIAAGTHDIRMKAIDSKIKIASLYVGPCRNL